MTNNEIAGAFRQMGSLLKATGESNEWRIRAYYKAANVIEGLAQELAVKSPEQLSGYLLTTKGLGESSIRKIHELLDTGTCPELEELKSKAVIVTPAEPKKRKSSKNHRAEVTAVRRPWTQAEAVVALVLPVVGKYFAKATVCGSYRRHKDTVKDIDIAVVSADESKATESAFGMICAELGVVGSNVIKRGPAQTSFYVSSDSGEWQVDIWLVKPESYGAAILFATGSAEFNVGMRGWCKGQGYHLNRYGLYRGEGEAQVLIAASTEEEIFSALGLKFVAPELRVGFTPDRI